MDYVRAVAERLAAFTNSAREAIDQVDKLGDANTADLFTEVSRCADKYLYFLEAHLQDSSIRRLWSRSEARCGSGDKGRCDTHQPSFAQGGDMRTLIIAVTAISAAAIGVMAIAWRRDPRIGSAFVNRVVNPWLLERGLAGGQHSEIGPLEHIGGSRGYDD